MYIVKYAGKVLNDYCDNIARVDREVLPSRENFSKVIPSMNGSYYTGYKYGERTIVIQANFSAKSQEILSDKLRKFADLLDVDSPSRIYINDEPNIYYYAVPDGSFKITKPSRLTASVDIGFICHNPLGYSEDWKSFSPKSRGVITFENEGTTSTNCILDVDFNKEACFFQATNPKGQTVLIGLPKDEQKPTVPVTDVVVDDDCRSASNFTPLAQSLLDTNRLSSGVFGVGLSGDAIICTNFGGQEEGKWNGVGFKRNLGQNVEEFEVVVDFVFSSEGKNYTVPPLQPKPPTAPPEVPAQTMGSYKVVNCGGLWINETADTSKPIYAMSPGTIIYPVEKSGIWMKHTHKAKYGTYTGWSSSKYLQKVSGSSKSVKAYAEDEIGMLEIYGFDQNGGKLFKAEVSDTNKFYEYVEPRVFIGTKVVVDDGKKAPSPRKVTSKNDSGKDEQKEVASGVFGDWNDLDGKIVIRREKNSKGQYLWSASVYKYKNGSVIRTMSTSNNLVSSSYPKGALNYLGFYIGSLGTNLPVDTMAIKNISVRKLNMKNDSKVSSNETLFKRKDHLQIDFETGLVTINGVEALTQIDIGSEFFEIPSGRSQIVVRSDDNTASIVAGIQERFL